MPVGGMQAGRASHAHTVRTPDRQPNPESREGAGMKRSLARPTAGAAAVMLLALTAAACSSSSSSSSASGGSTAATGGSTSGKSYKMTFIQGVAGDGFYVTMGCGIQAEAKKIGNITVNIQGPSKFDATLQNPIIESVTAAQARRDPGRSQRRVGQPAPDRRGHGRGHQGRSRRHHADRPVRGRLADLVGQPGRRGLRLQGDPAARARRRRGARRQREARRQHHRPAPGRASRPRPRPTPSSSTWARSSTRTAPRWPPR